MSMQLIRNISGTNLDLRFTFIDIFACPIPDVAQFLVLTFFHRRMPSSTELFR